MVIPIPFIPWSAPSSCCAGESWEFRNVGYTRNGWRGREFGNGAGSYTGFPALLGCWEGAGFSWDNGKGEGAGLRSSSGDQILCIHKSQVGMLSLGMLEFLGNAGQHSQLFPRRCCTYPAGIFPCPADRKLGNRDFPGLLQSIPKFREAQSLKSLQKPGKKSTVFLSTESYPWISLEAFPSKP